MKLIIDIPVALEERVKTAYAEKYSYQELVDDPNDPEKLIDNPETIRDFIKNKVLERLEEETSRYELKIQEKDLHKNFQRINLTGEQSG